jgi:hypothetical protein
MLPQKSVKNALNSGAYTEQGRIKIEDPSLGTSARRAAALYIIEKISRFDVFKRLQRQPRMF